MNLKVTPTSLPDVLLLEPRVFEDTRGFFFESFNARAFTQATGLSPVFVQDNHSRSSHNVVRGLHYQLACPQGKLVRAIVGEIYDVAVDVRPSSPTFGQWTAALLSATNRRQLWIPEGFAHGFVAISEVAEVLYKTTDFWYPEHERCILWRDPSLGIHWPLTGEAIVSPKDAAGALLSDAAL
jgi:dTDP-4-dehydrorhamnose 3,5-epimerase